MHQVIRTAKQKQLFMFLYWLGLLPQMQAFEHRLFETRGRTRLLSRPLVLLSKYWFSATMFEYAFSIY
ncbi:hypothetical protein DZ761_04855 [Enterococcus faecium]|nr:hypothetical protein [Enterococcus faecium]EGP5273171.1 hypothetical protein [Enterococcus faecium]EGP5296615.1 hypothetical protein [Enterococcus faecium]EGP5484215.1 hypothetical protein [Enterococcus faecium]EGP5518690.1 hypothetical protein [Enterococcus faecium]